MDRRVSYGSPKGEVSTTVQCSMYAAQQHLTRNCYDAFMSPTYKDKTRVEVGSTDSYSEYVTEHHIRHSWSCESCGHQFETLHDVRGSACTNTRRKIPTLLVA